MDVEQLIKRVLDCAIIVHKELGSGFLEKVYQQALMIELGKNGIEARDEAPISVYYRGRVVGTYYADLLVEDCLILELKAVKAIDKSHEMQLVNYLTATNTDNGLVLNFGTHKLEIKRKYRIYRNHEIYDD